MTTNGEVTTPETAAPVRPTGRLANVGLWILQVLLALAFGMAGASKLAGQEQQVELFDDIGLGQWLRYLTGALEVAGAIGLLIPALAGLAALGLAGVMLGAVLTDAFIIEGSPVFPLVLLALAALVAWGRRDRLAETGGRLLGRPRPTD
ncbi:DoxX family protein [Solwaraspora sp. WMMD1047]|uniref:DoxX family protein n=1 Tax=Solwaraspora sp. WMMD1047 TaxID=3016102 RepID=UPI002415AD72|nr:DoxX family protein [Solwaraspora sp. WMMD1047]MDG4828162.1 DoxX family protein [Solwaraspora sp. WMMD1047]